jgi:arabinofuranan 3-O-arabinosyltransferase
VTTVADDPRTADPPRGGSRPPRSRRPRSRPPGSGRGWRWFGFAALAAVAYVPVLLTHPGKVDADTKSYLYLDPGRLLQAAASMWDPGVGMGTVTHQNIGYLFPMGPFYWLLEQGLGVPSWVAQRLWLGSLIFAAGLGMRYLLRTIGMRGPGIPVGMLAYMFTPYVVEYSSRFTGLLGPWAALPWMIAFIVLALRRGGWKYPALFALTVQLVGGVNATALICAGLGPLLWIPYSVWVVHESTWRRALGVVWRTGLLTVVTSLWWITGLWAQSGYGLDILAYTETIETVSKTAYANEILRGLGYWFFYFRDRLGAWNDGASNYTQVPWLILVSYAVPTLALLAGVLVRWRHRAFFVLIALLGVIIAVGSSPFADPSPLGSIFKSFATSSTFGLALRSTSRAVPLVVLGLAALLAAGVSAVYDALRARGQGWIGLAVAVVAASLVLLSFPALWDDVLYSRYLERDEEIPQYWQRALRDVDAQSHDTRVLALPGSDFAAYRWGVTIDPVEPGLIDRPYVARELVPYGSPPSADLLNALDRRLQNGVLDPDAIAPIARLMGVGDVLLRMDMQTERYDLVRSDPLWRIFSPTPPPGLEPARTFGTKIPGKPKFPQIDERTLVTPPGKSPPPVAVLAVKDPEKIVRATPTEHPLLVSGNGEGLVDIASTGLLDGNQIVLYSGSYAKDPAGLKARIAEDATLVVTDTNRRRGLRWTGARDTPGYTEEAGEDPFVEDLRDARLDLFPGSTDATRTVALITGVESVQASGYGTQGLSYPPEFRPSRVLDGDVTTSWQVGGIPKELPGQRVRIVLDEPITTDQVNLLQPITGNRGRYITRATMRFDGGDPVSARLTKMSRDTSGVGQTVKFPRRTFKTFTIEIDDVHLPLRPFADVSARPGHNARWNTSAVGFAEIRMRDDEPGAQDVRVDEVLRMPTDLLSAAGQSSLEHPLVLTMTRDGRVAPPRTDPELELAREFALPTARDFGLGGTARLNVTAPDTVIDQLVGLPPAAAGGLDVSTSERLPGDVRVRGSAALDGDATTSWSTPFGDILGQWIEVTTPEPVTFDHLDLQVVNDRRHSVPRQILITSDDGTTRIAELPRVSGQPRDGGTVTVPVQFEAITGRTFTFTIEAVREVKRVDYQTLSRNVMPVAIAELGIPGVAPAVAPAEIPAICRTDLLTIDGDPVPVRISGSTATAVSSGPLTLELCEPGDAVRMSAGEHVLRTAKGPVSGVDFDRVVLSSAAGGDAATVAEIVADEADPDATPSPRLRVLDQDSTSIKVRVDDASEPFWMVLGQSRNLGWTAKADGKDLGEPKLVDGFANGWLVRPTGSGPMTITLEWVPQNVVNVGLLISILGGLLCIGIVAVAQLRVRRRRREARAAAAVDPNAPPDPLLEPTVLQPELASPFVSRGRRPSTAVIALTTIAAGALAALAVRPWCGLLVGGAVLLVLLRPRWRAVVSLFPFVALGLCGLYVAVVQFRSRYPVGLEWPGAFWRARTLGWLAIIFLAADVLISLARKSDTDPPGEHIGDPDPETRDPDAPAPEPVAAPVPVDTRPLIPGFDPDPPPAPPATT